jgi:Rps23 Pro-64 3,4-dihydroxylase Tpa1-like proline 4-hydroxylase
MKRDELALIIFNNLNNNFKKLQEDFNKTKNNIGYFYIDDLLPTELILEIYKNFPSTNEMVLKKSIREDKYIGVQMNKFNPMIEEIIFSFQDEKVLNIIGEICNIRDLHADSNLYAGGISTMKKNQFLNPHLDNSHNKDRELWRVLNLLFYVTPDWKLEYGGNLELWDSGLNNKITIESKFNRLVVMATHEKSIHSVSPINHSHFTRNCVSNYYFSSNSNLENENFHVTSFRERPGNFIKDIILQTDNKIRMFIRKIFKKGIVENPHVYKK